jgi:hypothetical protein
VNDYLQRNHFSCRNGFVCSIDNIAPLVCFGKYKGGTEHSRPLVGKQKVSPDLYLMYNLPELRDGN